MITIQQKIQSSAHEVWEKYTEPKHITQWNKASPEWYCPAAFNDVRIGGKFNFVMAALDESAKFAFCGTYTRVQPLEILSYILDDHRSVHISFTEKMPFIEITLTFEPEKLHPSEAQKLGWQAILDNFKRYIENK